MLKTGWTQFGVTHLLLATALVAIPLGFVVFWDNTLKREVRVGLFDTEQNQIVETRDAWIRIPDNAGGATHWDEIQASIDKSVHWAVLNDSTVSQVNDRTTCIRYYAVEIPKKFDEPSYDLFPIAMKPGSDGELLPILVLGDRVDVYGVFETLEGLGPPKIIATDGLVFAARNWETANPVYIVAFDRKQSASFQVERKNARSVHLALRTEQDLE